MEPRSIKNIFIWEGLLIGLLGALAGMLLAWLLTWLQEKFGLISLGLQTSLVKAYPVRRQLGDFIYVGLGVFLATLLASYKPASLTQKMMHVPKRYF
jgi:lipoprotein-releasing system permease protein